MGDPSQSGRRALRRRRILTVVVLGVVQITVLAAAALDHRWVHAAESLILPGAGLFEHNWVVGLVFALLALVAAGTWMIWGADWPVIVIWIVAMGVTIAVTGHVEETEVLRVSRAAHEVPIVMALVTALAWLRSLFVGVARFGGARRKPSRVDLASRGVVDRCRTASVMALARDAGVTGMDSSQVTHALTDPAVPRRARTIGLVARFRFGGDPFRRDHAHARTAMYLWGLLSDEAVEAFRRDGARSYAGVPASEPGWVRPLDATLAAVALERIEPGAADPWLCLLGEEMGLRRGHRPAWWYEPLGLRAGACEAWEHAVFSVVARSRGWVGDDDWFAIRRFVLGAAARHRGDPSDERLVAAGLVWQRFVDDAEAARILARRSPGTDPMARALAGLAETGLD